MGRGYRRKFEKRFVRGILRVHKSPEITLVSPLCSTDLVKQSIVLSKQIVRRAESFGDRSHDVVKNKGLR